MEMSNGCPVCLGLGRVVALGASGRPFPVLCPECAGLAITPASAEDHHSTVPEDPVPDAELRQTGPAEPRSRTDRPDALEPESRAEALRRFPP